MTAIACATREEWLARRRETMPDGGPRIQASELPVILWGEQLPLYLEKIGMGEDVDSLLMRRGQAWESVVADEYAQQTGRPVLHLGAFTIQQHSAIPWLGATLDRVTCGTDQTPGPDGRVETRMAFAFIRAEFAGLTQHPLQIKVAMGRAREWESGPPLAVLTQVQAEIACFGSSWGAIAALTNYFAPLQTFDVERDDEFLALALPHVEEFRARVRDRRPPEPRSSLALPALRKLYGAGDGTTIEETDRSWLDLAGQWEQAKNASEASSEWAAECRARLIGMMAGASFAWLPDGSMLAQKPWGQGSTLRREWPRGGRR